MKRTNALWAGVWWGMLSLFLTLTHPSRLPVFLLVVPFILLLLALYSSWGIFFVSKKRETSYLKLLGITVSLITVLCVGLESIGELTKKDFLTVLIFAAVAYFYIVRTRSIKRP